MAFVLISKSVSVSLTWDANTEPDLAGYKIYADPTSPPTTKRKVVGLETSTNIDVPAHGYYFGVRAFDTEGNLSEMSAIVQDV